MTQNTEQNVRTRDEQVLQFGSDLIDLRGKKACMEYSVAERHILEAEARGAAEQRRKDGESQKPSAWRYVGERGPRATTNFHEATLNALRGVTALYERPANVAALEARVKALEEYYEAAEAISVNASSEQCDRLDKARAALTCEGGV